MLRINFLTLLVLKKEMLLKQYGVCSHHAAEFWVADNPVTVPVHHIQHFLSFLNIKDLTDNLTIFLVRNKIKQSVT